MIKKMSGDFFLTICASLVTTGAIQMLVYPNIAKNIDSEQYGLFLTIMGIVNILTLSLGNNLANTRLLKKVQYEKLGQSGDFHILVIVATAMSAVSIILISCFLWKVDVSFLFTTVLMVIISISKSYYIVAFRLKLSFAHNLTANLVTCVGYIIGVYFLSRFVSWPFVFIVADLITIAYIAAFSKIFKERFGITPIIKETAKVYMHLIISGIVGNLITYLDRLLIYPISDGETVAIFTTASFFGKSLALIVLPITSVVFSYMADGKLKMDMRKYRIYNYLLFISGFLFILVSLFTADYITGWLYPTLIASARSYLFLANLAMVMNIMVSFSSVVILKYAPVYWQVILSVGKLVIYLALGITLLIKYQISGFCYSVLITNSVSFLVHYIIGLYYIKKNSKNHDVQQRLKIETV